MRVAHGALLNLAGHGAPLAAALFAVPALIEALGTERFGFLALAWALVGYVSLFDLGLGRALTRVVAERLGTPREDGLPELAQTALALTFALGAMAGGLVYLTASWVCERLLKLPPALVPEAVVALKVLALSLPLVTLTAAFAPNTIRRGSAITHTRSSRAASRRMVPSSAIHSARVAWVDTSLSITPTLGTEH